MSSAKDYTNGTPLWEASGEAQLELLKWNGCLPASRVLEVGAGSLSAGVPLMKFLDKGNYIAIEPNWWLIMDIIKEENLQYLIDEKQPTFLYNYTFNPGNLKYDFVISHSVLSHAAYWQLDKFMKNTAKGLMGKMLVSIRIGDIDSKCKEWQYPGVSYFSWDTIYTTGKKFGLNIVRMPEYKDYFSHKAPGNIHDWLLITKI